MCSAATQPSPASLKVVFHAGGPPLSTARPWSGRTAAPGTTHVPPTPASWGGAVCRWALLFLNIPRLTWLRSWISCVAPSRKAARSSSSGFKLKELTGKGLLSYNTLESSRNCGHCGFASRPPCGILVRGRQPLQETTLQSRLTLPLLFKICENHAAQTLSQLRAEKLLRIKKIKQGNVKSYAETRVRASCYIQFYSKNT